MRIAVVSTAAVAVPPIGYGGTELVLHYLAQGLVRAGHRVALFATGDSHTAADLRALYPTGVWPPDALVELNHLAWSVAELIRTNDVDVVHVNDPQALPLTRFLHAPVVHTMHHERSETYSRCYEGFPDVHYVAISAAQARAEVALPHLHVVHHGLGAEDYRFEPTAGDYVAFCSRFAAIKGPHLAIDAAREAGLPIRLAGRPHSPESQDYHHREVEPRLAVSGVDWVGELGGRDKQELLGSARATLFPICWEEPFGLVMIESMLCGTPVIAFPRGSAPEVIDEGVTGFLVRDVGEMAGAIRRVPEVDRARCRARAAERFSAERMVREYLGVYRDATGAGGRGRQVGSADPVHGAAR